MLEGGYDLQVIQAGAQMAGAILADRALPPDLIGAAPSAAHPSASAAAIAGAVETHQLQA